MSQLVSSCLSSLGDISPFEFDTAPSKCPYIVNWGKDGEYICGVMSQSGLLCAKHKNRKPQLHYSDEEAESEDEEEEETPPTERSKNKGRRTRESTPETSTLSRPNTARSKPACPSATKTPTHPITPRNKSTSTSTTDTPTSAEPGSPPRRSTRKRTPKATPKPASTRKLRSSLPGPGSTLPHTSTGTSSDGIEELTGRIKKLNVVSSDGIEELTGRIKELSVVSSDGIEELAGRIEDLNVEDEDDIEAIPSARERLNMLKRVNTAESVVSYGTGGPYMEALSNYLMKGLPDVTVAAKIVKELPKPPRKDDGPGYVYIFLATPKPSFQVNTDNKKTSTTVSSEEVMDSGKKMIIKVGSAEDPKTRMKGLCVYYEYKTLGAFPEEEGRTIILRYKAERMALIQLRNLRYPLPNGQCQCGIKHKELFHVTPKELKAVFRCVDYWATVVNADHEELWPGRG